MYTRYFIIKVGLTDIDKGKFSLFITRVQPVTGWKPRSAISYQEDRVAHPLSGRVSKRKE